MFLMGGAFVGMDDLLKHHKGAHLGFGGENFISDKPRLRDCLIEYGFIPEMISRIGSIIVIPDPRLPDLKEILVSHGGLLTCYGKLWKGMDMELPWMKGALKPWQITGSRQGHLHGECNPS